MRAHVVSKGEMRITFIGTGDAFGSGGRFNTCFQLETSAATVLIDCGASSLIAMNRLNIDRNRIDAIILSHLHGDHFGGLPFLLLECQFISQRSRPLIIAGPPGVEARVMALAEAMFPGSSTAKRSFAVDYVEIEPGSPCTICGIAVESRAVIHPSGAPATALRLECDGKVFAYSGDTEWTDVLLEIARDADLFVCECYARDREIPYHLCYGTLVERRAEFTARRMMLTHMGREMLADLSQIAFEAAEDGRVVSF